MAIQNINLGTSPNDGTGDSLRTGGEKVNSNFDYVDGLLNNRVQVNPVTIDWSQPVNPQILDHINNVGLSVPKDVVKILVAYRINQSGTDYSANYFIWTAGEGSYGTVNGNTITGYTWFQISSVSSTNVSQYDLGEIGATTIEDAVNNSGPYVVTTSMPTTFLVTRSGEDHVYLYVGTDTNIGLGETQTTSSDFVDLTEETPAPPDLSSYTTFSDLDNSLYDHATPGFSISVDNFTSLTDPFYLLEDTTDNIHYFASKQTNMESMEGARIYIRETGTHHDLGTPTLTQNGYNFWDLGNLGITINPLSEPFAFQFWIRNKDRKGTKTIYVDGQPFTYHIGGWNTTGTLQQGEPAKAGQYYDGTRWIFVETMIFKGANGTALNASTITDWDIKQEY